MKSNGARLSRLVDYEFLRPSEAIVRKPPEPARVLLAWTICLVVVVGISWACLSRIDVYAVAQGRIQPTGRSKVVQPFDAGKVQTIAVHEGSYVRQGDLLVKLNDTDAVAERDSLQQQQNTLQAEIVRRAAAVRWARADPTEAGWPALEAIAGDALRAREVAVLEADLSELRANIDTLRGKLRETVAKSRGLRQSIAAEGKTLATVTHRAELRKGLEADGWVATTDVLDAQEVVDRESVNLVNEAGELEQAMAQTTTLREQIEEASSHFLDENAQALEGAREKLETVSQDLIRASLKVTRTEIRSPMEGSVQQLAVTTVGQIVSPAQQLMTIVPAGDTLEVAALVANQDIGFVKVNQEAVIKVTSFPFTRYGTLQGKVEYVARDSITAQEANAALDPDAKPLRAEEGAATGTPRTQDLVFPAIIALARRAMLIDGVMRPLTPGMSVTVEIKTGRRRVIDYLLSPFSEATSEAMHER